MEIEAWWKVHHCQDSESSIEYLYLRNPINNTWHLIKMITRISNKRGRKQFIYNRFRLGTIFSLEHSSRLTAKGLIRIHISIKDLDPMVTNYISGFERWKSLKLY